MDVFSPAKRSVVMSRIRGKGNVSTEGRLITLFRQHKITGWRRSYPLLGKPDFVFPKNKIAVFIDGCFWHGCPKHFKLPQTRTDFWEIKINKNKLRDRHVSMTLSANGWKVVRIWEHELKKADGIRVLRILLGTCQSEVA